MPKVSPNRLGSLAPQARRLECVDASPAQRGRLLPNDGDGCTRTSVTVKRAAIAATVGLSQSPFGH